MKLEGREKNNIPSDERIESNEDLFTALNIKPNPEAYLNLHKFKERLANPMRPGVARVIVHEGYVNPDEIPYPQVKVVFRAERQFVRIILRTISDIAAPPIILMQGKSDVKKLLFKIESLTGFENLDTEKLLGYGILLLKTKDDNGTPYFDDLPAKMLDSDATDKSRYNRMLNMLEFLGVRKIAATGMFINVNRPGLYNSNLRGCLGRVVQNLKRRFEVYVGEKSITSNGYKIEAIEKTGKLLIDSQEID